MFVAAGTNVFLLTTGWQLPQRVSEEYDNCRVPAFKLDLRECNIAVRRSAVIRTMI